MIPSMSYWLIMLTTYNYNYYVIWIKFTHQEFDLQSIFLPAILCDRKDSGSIRGSFSDDSIRGIGSPSQTP